MQAVCSCLPNYIGSPPSCRPQCVVNSECDTSKACINQKCDDPCPNTCGLRAHCLVKNHNPICTCPAGMTGDPFTQCYSKFEIIKIKNKIKINLFNNLKMNIFIYSNSTSDRTAIMHSIPLWTTLALSTIS